MTMFDPEQEQEHRVSLVELLEVRGVGLSSLELLAILASSSEELMDLQNLKDGEHYLFTPEEIYLTSCGHVKIRLIHINDTPTQFLPPEYTSKQTDYPFASEEVENTSSEAQMIWCLGRCTYSCSADNSDIGLFSLLNLMTVENIESRPSLQKVRQTVRNKLSVAELDRIPDVIIHLYKEVLGDLDELIHDTFYDDIRFSSTRSSQLSIVPGPGAPEHKETRDLSFYQRELVSEVADRLKRDFSMSRKYSDERAGSKRTILPNSFDEVFDIPNRISPQRLQEQIPSPNMLRQTSNADKTENEDELTPRGPSPSGLFEQKLYNMNQRNEEENCHAQKNARIIEEENGTCLVEQEWGRNEESIQVEVHPISSPSTSTAIETQQKSILPLPHSIPTRHYAKATHTATVNKAARLVAKRAVATPEIEILKNQHFDEKNNSSEITWEITEDEKGEGEKEIKTTVGHSATTTALVTGYSPGTRRKTSSANRQSQKEQEERGCKIDGDTVGGQFHRRNSLQPERCSRRSIADGSARRTTGVINYRTYNTLPAVPEFFNNYSQPNIRLRAQSVKKKKMVILHRADPAIVYVHLLDGHTVEVNCKTDQLVGAVFHTVAEHLDLTEHIFFGLALKSFDEYQFLEEDDRLEKWAPRGWKTTGLRRSFGADGKARSPIGQSVAGLKLQHSTVPFVVHLLFRFYPKKREFVKTGNTAHQLYLQLRQDLLNGVLRFQQREKAIEMAALALCVEANSPADRCEYFKLENYLPRKFYDVEPSETLIFQMQIAELHSKMARQMGRLEAEEQFIEFCLSESYYGSHFYKVHKIKPKHGQLPFFGDIRLVSIMPSGIGISREDRDGAKRFFMSAHEWHMIRTLQFDRKRFLLGTIENGIAVDHVFYTDHHSKAAYLVRFAASQHRFMLKMRQWQGTLNKIRAMQRQKDVSIEESKVSEDAGGQTTSGDASGTVAFLGGHQRRISHPQMGIHQKSVITTTTIGNIEELDNFTRGTGEKKHNKLLATETDTEYIKFCYGPDAQKIDVTLEKHPEHGLGLTLVDGSVNGVKGVYVKSVSSEGDGKRKGILSGDCLLSINGVSLFNRTRHGAVDLVKVCGREVRLELLRFPSILEVLSQEQAVNVSSKMETAAKEKERIEQHVDENTTSLAQKQQPPIMLEKRKDSTLTNESRTSVSSGNPHSIGSNTGGTRRQRAISDFGTVGLPTLRTDDILGLGFGATKIKEEENNYLTRYRRHKTSTALMRPSKNILSSSDTEEEKSNSSDDGDNCKGGSKKGEYLPLKRGEEHLPPVSAMYGILDADDDEQGEENLMNKNNVSQMHSRQTRTSLPATNKLANTNKWISIGGNEQKEAMKGIANLDWTHDLSDLDTNTDCEQQHVKNSKNGSENTYNLKKIDLRETTMEHHNGEMLAIVLDKRGDQPIGLSLAKRMGHEGVYVRNIADDSLAAKEGTLRIGDRIWRIQGEQLAPDESPANVVKRLKEFDGEFSIHVKRKGE